MRAQDVLVRPLLTEKIMDLKEDVNMVAFEVNWDANKLDVKRAVETIWDGAKVDKVRMMVVPGKMRRQGHAVGYRSDWKKAYVRLTDDSETIDFFEGV